MKPILLLAPDQFREEAGRRGLPELSQVLRWIAIGTLYPEAQFPTVYFVIGRLTSGGTVSSRGLLIGAQVNSLGKGVDTSEINPAFVHAMGPWSASR